MIQRFCHKLVMLRRERGLSQEQLANELGVSRQSVSKWELGASMPDLPKIIQLSEMFQVSVDYLVKDELTEKQPSGETGIQEEAAVKESEVLKRLDKLEKNLRGENRVYEYKSKRKIGNLPLVHIHYRTFAGNSFFPIFFHNGFMGSMAFRGDYMVKAKGIIAIGNQATGVLAIGFLAKGLLSMGFLSLGGISLGLLSLGILSAGVMCAGFLAAGVIALGVVAAGVCAIGMYATGVAAVGKEVATGLSASGFVAVGKQDAKGLHCLLQQAAGSREEIQDFILTYKPKIAGWLLELLTKCFY